MSSDLVILLFSEGTIDTDMSKVDKPARRTQAERSAESRSRLVEAATECLIRVGYAATTTTLIAKVAGVSMGRMQHHFSTKADIMAAVAEDIQKSNADYVDLRCLTEKEPIARLTEWIDRLSTVFARDSALASFELRLAMRGDPDLHRVVSPIYDAYDVNSFHELGTLLQAAGMPRKQAQLWKRIIVAAARGLTLERVAAYGADIKSGQPTLPDLLEELKEIVFKRQTEGAS